MGPVVLQTFPPEAPGVYPQAPRDKCVIMATWLKCSNPLISHPNSNNNNPNSLRVQWGYPKLTEAFLLGISITTRLPLITTMLV